MESNNTDIENEIMKLIQQFREVPKSFLDKKETPTNKKKKKEYEDFINSLEKMPKLELDKNLCKLAEEELKKLSEDCDNYNKYQVGEEFEANINDEFVKNEVALIAIEEIENIEYLILKIIINQFDKDKKGRKILSNKSYTHIGFSKSDEEHSIILIFARKKEMIDNEGRKDEIKLTEEENNIFNQIKIFRNNPKSLLD